MSRKCPVLEPILSPIFAILVLTATPLAAQTAALDQKAAATIIKEDIARHIGVIADDSMMGRSTPSYGLEMTAQYVADHFKKFGLKPGGDNGTWIQRYPPKAVLGRIDFAQSHVIFAAGGKEAAASFTSTALLGVRVLPEQPANTGAILVAGRHTAVSVRQADLRGKLVLYIAPNGVDPAVRQQVLDALRSMSGGVIVLADPDSAAFAKQLRIALKKPFVRIGEHWEVHVWAPAVQAALTAAGLKLAQVRADTAPVIRELPQLTIRLAMKSEAATTPNAIGIIEGSDPKLKDEYIVISAHMDHIGYGWGNGLEGLRRGRPQPPDDSIYNGADDNGSGTAGIIELAEAFSQPGARPRRSLIFLTVGGEEGGGEGSVHFIEHPIVPIKQIVADFNIDMIGRNWKDTIAAIGTKYSDLGTTLFQVAAEHPELRMTPIDDPWPNQGLFQRSDQYYFARKGVPILFFFSGEHEDYHRVTDTPDKIDAEKEARILRLVFYLARKIGNTDQRPKWDENSYNKIVKDAQR